MIKTKPVFEICTSILDCFVFLEEIFASGKGAA